MKISKSLVVQPGNPECQDRAEILQTGDRTIVILADGAGGISGGAQAAEAFVKLVKETVDKLRAPEDCAAVLADIDRELARRKDCGETTGLIVIVDGSKIFGASVGDSAVRLFTSGGVGELTYGQQRKPLLGTGEVACPRSFEWSLEEGTLVAATDGLWEYTSTDAIQTRIQTRDAMDLARRLAELARLPSGAFQNDVAVITCRIDLAAPCP